MRSSHRMAMATLGAAGLSISLLAACSSDSDSASKSSTPQTTEPSKPNQTTGPNQTTENGIDPATQPTVSALHVGNFDEPISLVPRPGDDGHVWLAERAGVVRRLELANSGMRLKKAGDAIIDISDETTTDMERGLLSLAFSPDGQQLFLSFTDSDGHTRIVSYDMAGTIDDPIVDSESETLRFSVEQPYPNHNGGMIGFGPDNMLWLGLGDGGAADDPGNRAQDPSTPLGKMIRLDVLGEAGEVEPEIMVSGVRNPWRWWFDTDESLWIADVGQNKIEEINRLDKQDIKGANLGWSGYEGSEPYLEGDGRRPTDAIAPIFEYTHEEGGCSITGGPVYRGGVIPSLEGAFIFADYCAGEVRAIRVGEDGQFANEYDLRIEIDNPISFGVDASGEVYVLSQGGKILLLVNDQ